MKASKTSTTRRAGGEGTREPRRDRRKRPDRGGEGGVFAASLQASSGPRWMPPIPAERADGGAPEVEGVAPKPTHTPGLSRAGALERSTQDEAISLKLPGVLEARIERSASRGNSVQVQVLDATLATRGLVHGLSGSGWRVELKHPAAQSEHRSKDRRPRENRGENRERVERAHV